MKLRPFWIVRCAALCLAFALTACASETTQQSFAPIDFSKEAPLRINVHELKIVSEYVAPSRKPNVEHLMQVNPEGAAIRWAKDRLHPTGQTGAARVIIKDAKVVEVPLKTDRGVGAVFKTQQSERYDSALDVVVQILDERQFPVGEVTARATRSRTVPEGLSLNERDRILYEITESLIQDINSQMNGLLPSFLNRWMVN